MKLNQTDYNYSALIGRGALLTATDAHGALNTMTVSWGGTGVLWGKEVCFLFVRPTRHTFLFTQSGQNMSLSFFGEERADTLRFCGTKSGADVDKFSECDLKHEIVNGCAVFKDAKITLTLKKLYSDMLKKDRFIDTEPLKHYLKDDYHMMYVCEVLEVIEK